MNQLFQFFLVTRISLPILILTGFVEIGFSQQYKWEKQESGTTYTVFSSCFTDANTGWIAGGNNGLLFEKQISGLSGSPTFNIVEAVSQNTAWVLGGSDIIKTTDGGKTWIKKTGYSIKSLSFINENKGWAITNSTNISVTSNGGDNWTIQKSGSTFLNWINGYDNNHCWCVGNGGAIMGTKDGGTNWITQSSGTTNTLNCVYFVNDSTGWAVGVQGTILKTTNGGTTWTAQTSGTTETLNSVHFADRLHGGIAVDRATALYTTDGGTTWNIKSSLVWPQYDLASIRFQDVNTAYAVGVFGTILKTTNGGSSWTSVVAGTTSWLNGVDIAGESIWIVGMSGTILKVASGFIAKTSNGGINWLKQTSGTSSTLYSVHCSNNLVAWTVGGEGTILKTTDGGSSWISQNSGQTTKLYDVYFINNQKGWIVGYNGTILKTTNGGDLWEKQTSGTSDTLNSVFFIDDLKGFAAGSFGTLLKTIDGGTTWQVQSVSVHHLKSIFFVNANTGYISGLNETILKTVDGGNTWIPLRVNTHKGFYDIRFADQNTGWVAGSGGALLKTTTGGEIWINQCDSANFVFRSVFPVTGTNIYATGNNGLVLHSTNDQDLTAPVITVSEPVSGQRFTLQNLPMTLKGTVKDVNKTECTVNGEYVNLTNDTLNEKLCLSPFNTSIVIKASDRAGNITTKEIPVNVDIDLPGISTMYYLGGNNDLVKSRIATYNTFKVSYYTDPWSFEFSTVVTEDMLVNKCSFAVYFYSGTKAVTLKWYIKRNDRKTIIAQTTRRIASAGLYSGDITGGDYIILKGDSLIFEMMGAYLGGFEWGTGASGGYVTVSSDKATSLSAPVHVLPANNSVNNPTALSLKWRKVTSAAGYWIQVDDNQDFGSILYNYSVLTDTVQSITGLSNNKTYYWKVAATAPIDTSDWSAPWSFTTIPAIPDVPILSYPPNNSVNQPLSLSLIWNSSNGAASYSLQVSSVSDFSSTLVNRSGLTATNFQPSGMASGIKYYWRVKATNVAGTSAWSETWNFTTIPPIPGTPTLSSPLNNSTNQPLTLSLVWNASTNAVTYSLQVSTISDFSTTVVNQNGLATLNFLPVGLTNSTKYYWRVNASNSGGTSAWSGIRNFTTIPAIPDVPTLSSPYNNSINQSASSSLTWNTASGAASYSLQVSSVSDFSSTVINRTGLTATNYQPSGFTSGIKYYWRVSATNTGGTSAWSEIWNFTTIPPAPDSPILSSPLNNSTIQPLSISLVWNATTNAATYTLQISTKSDFSSTVVSQSGLTTTSYSASGLTNGTKYYWRVNATNAGGTSFWSSVWNFTTISVTPGIQASNLIISGITGNSATVRWTKGNGSRSVVFVKQGADGTPEPVDDTTYTAKASFGSSDFGSGSQIGSSRWYSVYQGSDSVITVNKLNSLTTYKVMVISFNGNAGDEKYLRQTAAGNPVTFTTTCDFDYYGTNPEVHLYYKNATTFDVEIANSHSCGTTIFKFLNIALTGNSFSINVDFYPNSGSMQGNLSADGNSFTGTYNINYAYSAPPYFITVSCGNKSGAWSASRKSSGPPIPVMTSPENNVVDQPLSFLLKWNPSAGAVSYSVQVSKSLDFSTLFISQNNIASTEYALSGLDDATTYYWRISAADECYNSNWSEMRNFRTIPAIPDIPALSLPANNSTNQPLSSSLVWNASAKATSYRLVISTDPDFTNLILSRSGLTTTSYSPGVLVNSTKYYWRVKALNETIPSDWSETWNFTTIPATSNTPALFLPANNSGNQPLSLSLAWNAVNGATSYALQVSTANDFSTTVVNQSGLTSANYSPGGLINGTKYYWRVNATNAGGTSAWSEIWNFTTVAAIPGVPTLLLPTDNSTNQPLSLSLVWNTASGATSYSLQVSANSDFSSTVVNQSGLTTTSYYPGGLINSTKYYWRVNATNAGGTSAWSQVWSYATIPATPGVPILSSPANGSTNQPLSLSFLWNVVGGATSYTLQVSANSDFSSTILNQSDLTSTSYLLSGLANGTKYYWRVNVTNAGGTSAWSEIWNFTNVAAIPGAPTLLLPTNNSTNQPLSLSLVWNAVSGATSYTLQVSVNSDFSSTILNQSGLTSTSYLPSGLANGTKYYWRVNSTNAGGTSAWSGVWNFTTLPWIPEIPVLAGPAYGSTNQPLSFTVAWNATERAEFYSLQVSTLTDFSTTIVSENNLTTTFRAISGLSNSTLYYWRVRASNIAGAGDWSQVWNFTTVVPVSIVESFLDDQVKIYPNPATGKITVEFSQPVTGVAEIKLYEPSGRMMLAGKLVSVKSEIDVSCLSHGIYFAVIRTGTSVFNDKLVIF